MAEDRPRCPGRARVDEVTTVRAAPACRGATAGGPPRRNRGGAVPVLAAFGGLPPTLGAHTAATEGAVLSSSYQQGRALGGFVLPVLLPAAAGGGVRIYDSLWQGMCQASGPGTGASRRTAQWSATRSW